MTQAQQEERVQLDPWERLAQQVAQEEWDRLGRLGPQGRLAQRVTPAVREPRGLAERVVRREQQARLGQRAILDHRAFLAVLEQLDLRALRAQPEQPEAPVPQDQREAQALLALRARTALRVRRELTAQTGPMERMAQPVLQGPPAQPDPPDSLGLNTPLPLPSSPRPR